MDDGKVVAIPPHPTAPRTSALSRAPRRRAALAKPLRIAVERAGPAGAPETPAGLARSCGTVWFDYTDLVHYFEDNRLPTGIQRVQIGIFRASLAREPQAGGTRVAACSFDTHRRCWVAIPDVLLASVCRAACHAGSAASDEAWRGLTGALRQSVAAGAPAPFAAGDVLVNIGSSWWIPDYLRFVHHLQRERGVLYAAFVHDCIPLRAPETCSAGLVEEFSAWFPETMRIADLVLANSEHTARDIVLLSPLAGGQAQMPQVVRLDARFDDGPQPGPTAAARMDATAHAALGIRRPFALFVATLEARKNHIFVFRCWKALIERHGEAVPDLICVGKQGWLFEYTQNWLRVHPQLAHRVRLLGTLSDHDVAALYRTAQFSVYCSHYEGWGLPITESLCYGRVPLVPEHTALPEAGGDLALYYTPGSEKEFCSQVERLMDRAERTALEGRIRSRYRPRSWGDVLGQIVATVREAPLSGAAPPRAAAIEPGRIYSLGKRCQPDQDAPGGFAPGERLKHGIGWHAAEEWGGWSRLAEAHLLFTLPRQADDAVLYLVLRGGPAERVVQVQAAGSPAAAVTLHPNQRRLVRLLPGRAAAGAELLLSFASQPYSLAPHTEGRDPREIGFGIESLALARRNDARARIEVLEHFLAG